MKRPLFLSLALASFGLCILSTDLKADEIQYRPAILDVDFDSMESIGLYSHPKDGGLGRDLWNNSRRSIITEMLPILPKPGSSATHQNLVMGALLTQANAELIDNDIDIEDGKDIFTLRLEKLNEIGAYKQSFLMYSALGAEPYHINLAKAGITAMLFNGERSLACLEYKTMEDRNFQSEFWDNLTLYCRYVLSNSDESEGARKGLSESSLGALRSIAEKSSYKINYSKSRFDKLSELERAIMVAEDRVIWPSITMGMLSSLPHKHVGMLMARDDLTLNEEFYIYARAAELGLVDKEMLRKFYVSVYDSEIRQLSNPNNLGWKQIAYAYHEATDENNQGQEWRWIKSAYDYKSTYGIHALSPFSDLLRTTDIEGQSHDSIETSLKVINAGQNNLPGKWIKYYENKKITSKFDQHLYFLSKIWNFETNENMGQDPEIIEFLEGEKDTPKKNYFKIIENIDKHQKNIHNADNFYVNEYDLTFNDSYVMPMPRVWDRLQNSSQHKRIGEAVLLSTAILRKQALPDHYPGVAGDVSQILNIVGLTKTSKNLVLELVLDTL